MEVVRPDARTPPMTTADAFLQAILDDPDADAPRLVFADWLEEHGDAERAEFIRVQCALDRPPSGGHVADLWARQGDLLAVHEGEWAAPANEFALSWIFRRGFIDEIQVEKQAFPAVAEALFRRHPVRRVRLYGGREGLHARASFALALAYCPQLDRLRSLDLSGNFLGSDGVRALAVSPYLTRLRDLDLSHSRIGDAGARALAESDLLPRLVRLDLSGNDIGPAGVRALEQALEVRAAHGEPPRLHELRLDGNAIGEAGRRAILHSPVLRRATRR
jgi:uncharacterized protein (TIGR02996 family)